MNWSYEAVKPDERIIEMTKKILEQHQTIIDMNVRLMQVLINPQWIVGEMKK